MYLPLTAREKSALREYAEAEDRDPRIQAARFVREGLERVGVLDSVDSTSKQTDGLPGEAVR